MDSSTLDELAIAKNLIAAAKRVGMPVELLAKLAADPQRLRQLGEGWSAPAPVSQSEAELIMGVNFRGTRSARFIRMSLTREQRRRLDIIPFSAEELGAARLTHVLIPGLPLTLVGLGRKAPAFFDRNFGEQRVEPFRKRQVRPGWYLIRKKPVLPGDTYDEQQRLLLPGESVPYACELALAVIICQLGGGSYIPIGSLQRRCRDTHFQLRVQLSVDQDGHLAFGYAEETAVDLALQAVTYRPPIIG